MEARVVLVQRVFSGGDRLLDIYLCGLAGVYMMEESETRDKALFY